MIRIRQLHYYPELRSRSSQLQLPDSARFELYIDEFDLADGTHTVLTGGSGSGKTTLLNLIAGILSPCSGSIEIDGDRVSSLSDAARRQFRIRNIGLVFQEFELVPYLNVLDNILLPGRINSAVKLDREVRDRACELAANVGIEKFLRRPVHRLSQGERQRVAICRALLLSPRLILADEPTGNLDPETSERIVELLLDQARSSNANLLMVTHDHSLLPRFGRAIAIRDLVSSAPVT